MKRSYLIILLVSAVVIISALLWLWFFGPAAPAPTPGTTGSLPSTETQASSSANGGSSLATAPSFTISGNNSSTAPGKGTSAVFGIISNGPVADYFVTRENKITIVQPDGEIVSISNGVPAILSASKIENLIKTEFSYDGSKVLVSFGDPGNPQASVFDLASKAWAPLPLGMLSPTWAPSDYRIAYLKYNTDGTAALATMDVSKAAAKPVILTSLHIQDVEISWPTKTQIALNNKPSSLAGGSVLIFDPLKNNWRPVVLDRVGADTMWSNATSSTALFFYGGPGGRGGTLSLYSLPAGKIQPLAFLTMPSKCIFNNEGYLALYCAVPQDPAILAEASLPEDYNQMALFTVDTFYRLRTDSGIMEKLFVPAQSIDASSLRVFNNILFFVNRYDQKLYALSLAAL